MHCPSCGRPIEFEEKYAKVINCMYCNSVLEFGGGELTKLGEQGEFIQFPTLFEVGKTIEWETKQVYVKGQLRYEYAGGFFDVFFVTIGGEEYYIQEDDGTYTLLQDNNWQVSEESIIDKPVGENALILGKDIFVQEVGLLKLVNIRGFINNTLIPGKEYEYLDGILDGSMILIYKERGVGKLRVNYQVSL